MLSRFAKDIHHYFLTGYLNKFDERKRRKYNSEKLDFEDSDVLLKPRDFDELHNLALDTKPTKFVNQLMLTEVPKEIYQTLIARYQGQAFSLPVIASLPYEKRSSESLHVKNHESSDTFLTTPNVINSKKRNIIKL